MGGLYGVEPAVFCEAMAHLLVMPHVTVEHWDVVSDPVGLQKSCKKALHTREQAFAGLSPALPLFCARAFATAVPSPR